jgi:hypothetical protein
LSHITANKKKAGASQAPVRLMTNPINFWRGLFLRG